MDYNQINAFFQKKIDENPNNKDLLEVYSKFLSECHENDTISMNNSFELQKQRMQLYFQFSMAQNQFQITSNQNFIGNNI